MDNVLHFSYRSEILNLKGLNHCIKKLSKTFWAFSITPALAPPQISIPYSNVDETMALKIWGNLFTGINLLSLRRKYKRERVFWIILSQWALNDKCSSSHIPRYLNSGTLSIMKSSLDTVSYTHLT